MPRFRSVLRHAAGRFIPHLAPPLRCVGCGRDRGAGVQLISGPGFYICSDCVNAEIPRTTHGNAPLAFRLCRWCRAPRLPSQLMPLGGLLVCACCRETLAALAQSRYSPRENTELPQ